jgi:hypothetical protein
MSSGHRRADAWSFQPMIQRASKAIADVRRHAGIERVRRYSFVL